MGGPMVATTSLGQAPAVLRFYFDYISPFAYLGWIRLGPLAEKHARTIEPIPVLFAALLNAHGHKGPAEIPPKRVYVFKQVNRLAADYGVPLQPPPAHPFNPLLSLRLSCLPLEPSMRIQLIGRLFERTWASGQGVENADELAVVLDELGLDGRAQLRQAGSDATKRLLRNNTERALDAGVFGVPTFEADGELFWGQDSLPHLDRFLRGEDPVDAELLARWKNLPASAQRR
ncbi:MAG: 2-hydroxychromene-2-carboxylate isomerase [Myxococcota bacterium]